MLARAGTRRAFPSARVTMKRLVQVLFALTAILGIFTTPFADVGQVYGFSIAIAVAIGILATLPPSRPSRRTALTAGILAFLAWFVARAVGLSGDVLTAVVIEGAMPVMVLSLVLADEFELDVQLAATCIAVGIESFDDWLILT